MLTSVQLQQQRRRRPPPSLKQQYQEYILQRIEGFKNSMPREELLRLGDEAVSELAATAEGQFVLTEVLMLESVDRLIMKRLSLRSYRRWRQQYIKLRAAQQEPTHWAIDSGSPISLLLPRLEPDDAALVVGAGAEGSACLLAAHDLAVTFVAADLGTVERLESVVGSESLGSRFSALVVQFGRWLPEFGQGFDIVVVHAAAVADLRAGTRQDFISELQSRTQPGGVHVILPGSPLLSPEAVGALYEDWIRESRPSEHRRGNPAQQLGIMLTKPPCRSDTEQAVSQSHG